MEASVKFKEIDITLIEVSGANPRKDLKGETFKELKQSIAEHGILEPLVIRPKGPDKYELVAGERRLRAAKELKFEMIPVAIRELDDHSARVVMLLENLQREDLEPLEEASAIEELLKDTGDGGMTQEELAKKLAKSQPWIANRLRLNKAPPELKKLLEDGKITPQHVIVLLPYTEHKVLKDEIVASVKNNLEDLEQGFGEPLTVEWTKDLAEDILSEQGQDLDLQRNYNFQGLEKFFDFSKCDACKTVITIPGEKGKKERTCLNKTCFGDRIGAARVKLAETQKEKVSKATVVNTDKLSYREYRELEGATFDTKVCKDCPNHKLQKPRYAKFGKSKDELEEICLKPSCFQGKTAQKTRLKHIACREELAFVEESLKRYLESRPSGFTWTELRFIVHRLDESRSPKKNASLKDLEDQLLRHVMDEELRDFKYNLNLARLKQIECEWPFKIKRKMPEEPAPKKKVQEKRKKKGVCA